MAKGISGGLVAGLTGKAGNTVFVHQRDGTVTVRSYTPPRNPKTAAQEAVRANTRKASAAFNALTPAQYAQWQVYAKSLTTTNSQTGLAQTPRAHLLYIHLAAKLLQAVPNATLPTVPPTQDFVGDGIKVTVTAGIQAVNFTASQANSANVVTELLLQPLRSVHRTPVLRSYRPAVFFGFTTGQLSKTVTAKGDWFACAVRFVHKGTGQASAIIELGKVQVGFVG